MSDETRVLKLVAIIAVRDDGGERLFAIRDGGEWMPFVGAEGDGGWAVRQAWQILRENPPPSKGGLSSLRLREFVATQTLDEIACPGGVAAKVEEILRG